MVNKFFGKKIGMTRCFLEGGLSVPVTVLKAGPCIVIQKKTEKQEGYNAIQVAFDPKKEQRVNKPQQGHFKVANKGCFAFVREIRVDDVDLFEIGQEIKSDILKIGESVHVSSLSKGRGFAGVMKRWGFSGGRKTHGSRSHRIPGSIGCSATPGKVQKGRKLPGRMGSQRVTVKNLKVIDVRPDIDLVLVGGAVPGGYNGFVEITKV